MQKSNRKSVYWLVSAGLIAALYIALTYFSSFLGIAYGNIQFRLSEALTLLPIFTSAAIPGLTIGCLIGNLASPLGVVDIICGTAATLAASLVTRIARNIRFKNFPFLSFISPVIFNAFVIGLELAVISNNFTWPIFLFSALQVGVGELAVCTVLAIPLNITLEKSGLAKKMFLSAN